MVEWYRVECTECDPIREHGPDHDHYVTTRFPFEDKAEIMASVHDSRRHGGNESAEVVRL